MNDLNPGLLLDQSGRRRLSAGSPLDSLDDDTLLRLAKKHHATHIVLPKQSTKTHKLPKLYENDRYALYKAELPPIEVPKEARSKERWEASEQFMRDVIRPNIEKHRKGDLTIRIVDANGKPLGNLPIEARQTSHQFNFSASLPFFKPPASRSLTGDFQPPPVDPRELAKFQEIFNASLIPFSGKWMYVEPTEGQRNYEDLDAYVDWCAQRGYAMEYHFLTGYSARWVNGGAEADVQARILRHARDVAARYRGRIEFWQVVNEQWFLQFTPEVFRMLRREFPEAKLGISDCARFWSEGDVIGSFLSGGSPGRRGNAAASPERDMLRGIEEIKWLKEQGITLDFFGFHGHRPFGLWPDPREMYSALDAFAAEGVRLHISEFTVPTGGRVLGPLRGGSWTPELQAEFYEWFYTVCFSHPAVDLVNLWGMAPVTWQRGSGLLDANYAEKPNFARLKSLIHEKWKTNTTGRLNADGQFAFRGFGGTYDLTLRLPNGQTAKGTVSLPAGKSATIQFRLDNQTLTPNR